MTIAIASGKGGTGKTTVAVGLAEALSSTNVKLLDCDVEEPNDHLFLAAEETDRKPFAVKVPRIDEEKCTACGECVSFCEFNALVQFGKKVMVFDNLCHGCGGCSIVCPENAIREEDRPIGELVWGRAEKEKAEAGRAGIGAIRGVLNVGEVLAPPLIREVKRRGRSSHTVREGNTLSDKELIIIDSPPGTTCPMVTAVKDADFGLLVTENTPFGLHDLELAVETIGEMGIPMGVVINRSDVGHADVEEYCRSKDIPVMLKIPYDETVAAGYAKGKSIVDSSPEYGERFRRLSREIEVEIERRRARKSAETSKPEDRSKGESE